MCFILSVFLFCLYARGDKKKTFMKNKDSLSHTKSILHQVQKPQSRPDFIGNLFWLTHFKVQLAKHAGIKRHFLPWLRK